MSDSEITGRCLCDRVAYAIQGHLGLFQYCHCSRCRKFTGSAFAANRLVAPADFRWIAGAEFVGRYELAEAKRFAASFCTHCGSPLPWRSQSGQAVVVPAGTLDVHPGLGPFQNIFWNSRANLLCQQPNTKSNNRRCRSLFSACAPWSSLSVSRPPRRGGTLNA